MHGLGIDGPPASGQLEFRAQGPRLQVSLASIRSLG